MIPSPLSYGTPLINDMGKLSFLNPTNENGVDKNNHHEKIKNLIIELTPLKLFVQEQFYIMKKHLEETSIEWDITFKNFIEKLCPTCKVVIKSILIHECQHECQHESTRVEHESTRVEHESKRVQQELTRINTSTARANTNQHEST